MNWGFNYPGGSLGGNLCSVVAPLIWLLVKTARYGRPHQYTWAVGRPAAGV
jgi:hypothetical protein